jgi:hypothetical protein
MKKLILTVALLAGAALPSSGLAGTFTGIVLDNGGGRLAVAAGGVARAVPTKAQPAVGARVRVSGRSVRVIGHARSARFRGTVVRSSGGRLILASGRSLIAVRGRSASPGAVVNATVDFSRGRLIERELRVVGERVSVTVQAKIIAVGPASITLLVNGQSLTIPLPAGIQLPVSLVGQTLTIKVRIRPHDRGRAEDEDEIEVEIEIEDEHGDNRGDDHGDDHRGHGGGGDDDHGGRGHGDG